MTVADLPSLWRSSDAAARECQRRYLTLVRIHLSLLAASGLLAAWVPQSLSTEHFVAVAVALTMFLALLVGLVLRLGRLDESWFRARAFAENTKGSAWRFMMKPKPALQAEDEAEERGFLDELLQIRGRFPQIEKHLSEYDGAGKEITAKMREVRSMPTADRLAHYKHFRLQDQIDWYRKKAKINAVAESRWFWGVLATESIAIVMAAVRIWTVQEYNPTGGIAALAACFLAWSETRNFSHHANSYGVACRDLNGLQTSADHVHDETHLQVLVNQVEMAVSREHRLWIDRLSTSW